MFATTSFFKHAVKAATLIAALVIGTGVSRADTMLFSGNTTGSSFAANSSTDQGLTYAVGTFSGLTSNSGFVAFGGGGSNFGAFSLSSTTNSNFNNDLFTLVINFTNPAGVNPNGSSYSATVIGSVTSTQGGGAQVSFSPASRVYSFSDGTQTGTFTLNLNNVSVFSGQTATVTGNIQTSVTPEPMSLALMGTGLLGIAGLVYRRRNSDDFSFGSMAA